ncbi:hypothetical protein FBU31_004789 [Coemansia sp. 'formosensis']|nr:hypothetical protein FBU31_004789 [Coemansia sp. 'formosensis']
MLDEWDVDFSLVFDPKDRVDKYVGTPVEVTLGALHIDALDAIIPTSKPASSLNNGKISVVAPCLCEVWLCPTSPVTNDDLALTTKLLHTLLLEAVTPQTRARTTAIMLDRHTAEFCIAGTAGSTGAVSVMCGLERDHLALRIQSATDWLAFAAVCYSLSKRLSLLLEDATSGNSTSGAGQSLLALQEKYAGVIVAADQGRVSYDGACRWGRPQAVDFVDFTMVKGDLTLSLLE